MGMLCSEDGELNGEWIHYEARSWSLPFARNTEGGENIFVHFFDSWIIFHACIRIQLTWRCRPARYIVFVPDRCAGCLSGHGDKCLCTCGPSSPGPEAVACVGSE